MPNFAAFCECTCSAQPHYQINQSFTIKAAARVIKVVVPKCNVSLVIRLEGPDFVAHYATIPSSFVSYFLILVRPGCTVSFIKCAEATLLGCFTSLAHWALIPKRLHRRITLSSGCASVKLVAATSSDRKKIVADLLALDGFNLNASNCYTDENSQLVLGLDTNYPPVVVHATKIRLCVVVHLFYLELWEELAASLSCLPHPFDLIVTISSDGCDIAERIRAAFPFSVVRFVKNIGRDVRPLFELLDEGAFDIYDVICKIHGKKSVRNGASSSVGELWRRSSLLDLVSGHGRPEEIYNLLQSQPEIGLIGPEQFRLPNKRINEDAAWGANKNTTLRIAYKFGIENTNLDFFAGTMFWVRPNALSALKNRGLGDPASYASEYGQLDGEFEHMLERLIPMCVVSAGYRLHSVGSKSSVYTRIVGSPKGRDHSSP